VSLDAEAELEDLMFDEEPEYDGRPVGDLSTATEAMFMYSDRLTELEAGRLPHWNLLGEGSFRTALLHIPTSTVYKLPRELGTVGDANPAERAYWRMMTLHWEQGWDAFVPPHQLFTVVEGGYTPLTVMALPYMGGAPLPGDQPLELIEAAAHVGCFDARTNNVRFHRGQWYLIDASGNEWAYDPTMFGPQSGDGCEVCNLDYAPGGTRTIHDAL
jgi:hypothetical protein